MSRTRLIRPEFFNDERMAGLSIATRFVYIGLWTLCDDAGYFERKPRQIAAELFPYDGLARRQKVVDAALGELVTIDRVRYLDCDLHGVVPTLPKHGAKGGTKAETYLSRHRTTCVVRTAPAPVRTRPDESSSDSVWDSGIGSVSESAGARAPELDDAARKAGGFAANHAASRQDRNGHGREAPVQLRPARAVR